MLVTNYNPDNLFDFATPFGILEIALGVNGVLMIDWRNNLRHEIVKASVTPFIRIDRNPFMKETILNELSEYFDRRRRYFTFPLEIHGTLFQKRVWLELQKIPYGRTSSYKEIGRNIGCVKGLRAVGTAIGRNPLNIVIPCHRILRHDGSLGGYAGGVETKRHLVTLEKIN